MITKRIAFGLIIALLVSLLIVSGQFKARAGGASAPSLEGSWDVTVGPSGPTQFKTLITYGRGGSLVATAPVVPPPFHASTVHGTWEKTGNKFTYTFLITRDKKEIFSPFLADEIYYDSLIKNFSRNENRNYWCRKK